MIESGERPGGTRARGIAALWPGLLAAGFSAALYASTLHNPFVYDDRITVVENPSIRSLGDVRAVLRHDLRPLANLSFAIDYATSGASPVAYHVTNIALHAINVLLVFALISRLGGDLRRSAPGDSTAAPLIAFVTAALFAVHPMMTEAVSYVSGRSDLLATAFFLLAFLGMRAGLARGQPWFVALALVPFGLALASKEVAVMLPFVVLAYDRLILRPPPALFRRRFLRVHLPLLGAVLVLGAARVAVFLAVEHAFGVDAVRQMLGYLLLQFEAVPKYIRLLALPARQSIAHTPVGLPAVAVVGALALALICLLAVLARRRMPLVSFGVAWFLLSLVPSSSVLPLQSAIAEHRVYLASIGFFLVVACAFAHGVHALQARALAFRLALCGTGLLVLAGLAGQTVIRNLVWANPVALWREAAVTAPRWDTYMALGNALRDAGDCTTALAAYGAALRADPGRLLPRLARWTCLTILGRTDDAQEVVRQIREIDPHLERLCQEARSFAPHMMRSEDCVKELRPVFGAGAGG